MDNNFTSDGCTFFPDTIRGISLLPPCVEHDYAYYLGGSKEDRLKADKQLRKRVKELGMPKVAATMYYAVRFFGGRFWPRKKFWGYEWSKTDYGYGYGEDVEHV